ncbi:hypothetical protein ES703_98703 [subsurface metagenome]
MQEEMRNKRVWAAAFLFAGLILFIPCCKEDSSERPAPEPSPELKNESSPRQPAVAGSFYPEDPEILEKMVSVFLAKARNDPSLLRVSHAPVLIIAPHAGYVFSGQTAAYAYAAVAGGGLQERYPLRLSTPPAC